MIHDNDKLSKLKAMLADGTFHHATYRDIGKCWEGLFIYPKEEGGFRGYGGPVFSFRKNDPDLEAAHELLRGTGASVGAYGRG